jgi:hypothetical protein
MDIDERLAALTQTVELLASFHKDGEKRMERLDIWNVWVSTWSSSLNPPKA